MPESTGVVTFEDVLTWAAEQGALTDPCGVVPGTGVAQALRRVAEISQRASSAPASMRTFDGDGQRIEAFIAIEELKDAFAVGPRQDRPPSRGSHYLDHHSGRKARPRS